MNKKEFREKFVTKYPNKNIISIRQSKKYNYFIIETLIEGKDFGCDDFVMKSAYDENSLYLGNPKTALALTKRRGITTFEKSKDTHTIASIGFNPELQKWYGWSHRAIYEFGIGSKVKKGDSAYQASNELDFIEDCVAFWSESYKEDITAEIENRTDEETGKEERGVMVSWKYSNDVPNEKIRGEITGAFTRFPEVFGRGEWKAKTLEDAKRMAKDFAEDVS